MITNDKTTLKEAKTWLREQAWGDGAECPCCKQFAKVYRRKITSAMVRGLVYFHRFAGDSTEFFHLKDVSAMLDTKTTLLTFGGGDFSKLVYWGLIEEKPKPEEKDTRCSGEWRITEHGRRFLRQEVSVPKYVHLYDGRLMKFSGENVYIRSCFKDEFSFSELMNARVA